METVILSKADIDQVASFLLDKQIVCFPTETVFGMAIVADDEQAYDALIEAKHRPKEKAFPLLIQNLDQLNAYAQVRARTLRIMTTLLPGPLTLVMPKKEHIADYITAGAPTIAVRWSDDPFVNALLQKVGKPLLLTSANRSGEATCKDEKEAYAVFQGNVACIVEGTSKGQQASTIVDVSKPTMRLLREGPIELQTVINQGGKYMKIVVGSDHAGYPLKEAIKTYLQSVPEYEVVDVGPYSCDSTDYPSYGILTGEMVAKKEVDTGVVICGSGIGISISANKVKGIRCALVTNAEVAALCRQHNDANMMALPGRFITNEEAITWTKLFLSTPFEGGRHQKRIDLLHAYEANKK